MRATKYIAVISISLYVIFAFIAGTPHVQKWGQGVFEMYFLTSISFSALAAALVENQGFEDEANEDR